MLLRFFGAARTVTGSCHLLEVNGLRVLLDFGLFQGRRDESREFNSNLPPGLERLDAVVLSHGHLDHCGRLPLLARLGYRGPIYCTPATAEVARVVMLDAAKIQEEDANYLNRRANNTANAPIRPLFTTADVMRVLPLMKTTPLGEAVDLGNKVAFTFHEAGHILGSAYVTVEYDEGKGRKSLLFTADLGRSGSPIIRDPAPLTAAHDLVITESTYGLTRHSPMSAVGPQLLEILKTAIAKRGRVIFPSFAVGRTQTMLWYVQRFIQQKLIPEIPIFVDSPMGVEISRIHERHSDAFDEETRAAVCDGDKCDLFGLSRVTFAVSSEESRKINMVSGAAVVIASSPTCEFGRVLHHLRRSVENPDDTVVFVGWTPPNTLGRRLQDLSKGVVVGRDSRVRILDRFYDLRCTVKTLHGLSAHADGDELLAFLGPTLKPGTTAFVVHGEDDRCDGFAARLTAAGMGAAIAPAPTSSATLGETSYRIADFAHNSDE